PRPAAEDPLGADGSAPGVLDRGYAFAVLLRVVLTPLPDVAVHVVESPGVGLVTADDAGAFEVGAAHRGAIGLGAVKVGLGAGQRLAYAERGVLLGAGAGSVFPLGLGGQAIDAAGALLGGQVGELLAEVLGVLPVDVLDGQALVVDPLD